MGYQRNDNGILTQKNPQTGLLTQTVCVWGRFVGFCFVLVDFSRGAAGRHPHRPAAGG